MKEKAYIIFTRIPTPGKVKTRLSSVYTPTDCATIQQQLLADLFQKMAVLNTRKVDVFVAYSDEQQAELFLKQLPKSFGCFPQIGSDIGRRMDHAFNYVKQLGYKQVVLTGSDIPKLTSGHIEEAFEGLNNQDCVLGPTQDGGYYLIGTNWKNSLTPIFISNKLSLGWGGASVFAKTTYLFKQANYSVYQLSKLLDIDEPTDIAIYRKEKISVNKQFNKWLEENECETSYL